MSHEADRQVDNAVPPRQSTTPGEGVTLLATSTTAAAFDLSAYDGFFNKPLLLTAGATAIWVSFGAAATPVIDKSYAGGATIAAGTKAENGVKIAAGASLRVRLSRSLHKFMHVQADSSTPVLEIRPIAQKGPKR
jgi:hypothetical protein